MGGALFADVALLVRKGEWTSYGDVARAVGINRAIIYRHFTGKEELFALTLVGYLEELDTRLAAADDPEAAPVERLRRITEAFFDYGLEYPAFVDCAQTLMRRPGSELWEEISEGAMFRLGRGISTCLARVGLLVKEAAPGVPTVATLSREQVREHLVASSIAMAVGAP